MEIIEKTGLIYSLAHDEQFRREDMAFLVKQEKDGETFWQGLVIGWEYRLWQVIGERGGLAEAGELFLMYAGEKTPVTIEDYITRYRQKIACRLPGTDLFKRFNIKVTAQKDILPKEEENTGERILRRIIEEKNHIPKIAEENGIAYYEKDVYSIQDLKLLPDFNYKNNSGHIRTWFYEK